MKRMRVLMLGWEFPPAINGGLGVACHGLAKALASQVDLQVLVPQIDRDVPRDGFELRGANEVTLQDLAVTEKHYRYESFSEVEFIPVSLDPYTSEEAPLKKIVPGTKEWVEFSQTTSEDITLLGNGDLYGDDLGMKVIQFSKIAAKLALQSDFDLIHAHDWMTWLAGVEVKRVTGKPLVVHLHASQYDRAGSDARGWIYDLEKIGMTEADRVIPVSHYTGRVVVSHYGIESAKVRPIHNGAEPVSRYRSRRRFPEKVVLFLGRLTAQKGPEFFLEIAGKVIEREPAVRFVMAGKGDKLRQLIETGAFKGLGGRFHFTGFLAKEKVNELLSMTDVYCMPSVSEPFGLSALEAAQFGIPAVLSKQSGVAEVLQGALKADYWDTNLMAEHIVHLIRDGELRDKVVKQAAIDIKAATWDAAAGKVMSVYHELLS
ncbi:MAG: glycosyltransferase [Roseibacillus sp.]|jgi:glycosyltransferase involved in cell wall biosynthesis|nr:glycosyltransferase [Roseibacillus sp.]